MRWRLLILPALLIASAVLPYVQAVHFGFVGLDDQSYVTRNPFVREGLTWEGLRWAWTTGHMANWHPLTWLSHMLDCELWGLDAAGHHATSVLLHLANTFLVFAFLRRATGAFWRSALVAALFAAHPLRVESVAWVAERKDVLSASFGLLALYAYVGWTQRGGARRYGAAGLFLALGLLAKPMLVTVPFLFLLLDFWPLRRWHPLGARVLEKLPLLALSMASAAVTLAVQQQGGAVPTLDVLPLDVRVTHALVSLVRYLAMVFWPVGLSVHYPHPRSPGGEVWSGMGPVGAGLLLVALTAVGWRLRRRGYPLVAWLWFTGMLLPVIGLVQVGSQAVADRYTYLPSVGLTLGLVWGARDLLAMLRVRPARVRAGAGVLAGAVLVACLSLSWQQARLWRGSIPLYERALALHRADPMMLNNLGEQYRLAGRLEEAIALFREALAIDPRQAKAANNLGLALHEAGDLGGAIEAYGIAAELTPEEPAVPNNLGIAFQAAGRLQDAVQAFQATLRIAPGYAPAFNNLGVVLERQGKLAEARAAYERAVEIDPWYVDAHYNLARMAARDRDWERAEEHYREVLSRRPDHVRARRALAEVLLRVGRLSEAITALRELVAADPGQTGQRQRLGIALKVAGHLDEARDELATVLRQDPDALGALVHLADILVTHPDSAERDVETAVRLAERAVERSERHDARALQVLAAAYAAGGRFAEAVRTGEEALQRMGDRPEVRARAEQQLEAYRAGRGSSGAVSP